MKPLLPEQKKGVLKPARQNTPEPKLKRKISEDIIKSAKKLQEEIEKSIKRKKMFEEDEGNKAYKTKVSRFNDSVDPNQLPEQLKGKIFFY